ncbi:hypothetical protein [Paenarthrobacter aurescens]|uniref:hypothetical protein n=1 Tax=Paenarthrobacter aurescens TaxID=43663 RepID=UPI00031CEC80|nr:hypothetical protein [Paenarthrobacter aurescens]
MFQWPIQLRPGLGGGDAFCISFFADTYIPAGDNHAVCRSFPASFRRTGPGAEHTVTCGAATRSAQP